MGIKNEDEKMLSLEVPTDNVEVYKLLFCIETALRELITELLELLVGPKWYLSRLPQDIREKYEKARAFERNVKWTSMIPLHPIYYTDFADLRKIILRKDNWREVFKDLFQNENHFESMLAELDLIRNKIAHNRKATPSDLEITRTVYLKLTQQIGNDRFGLLSAKCTRAPNLQERLSTLRACARSLLNSCIEAQPISDMSLWEGMHREWWFDESYLGSSIAKIQKYFSIVEAYSKLPRFRGMGHTIEDWVKSSSIQSVFDEASSEFGTVLRQEKSS